MPTNALVEKNAYDAAMENFDLAADALGLDDDVRSMIKYPERALTVVLPVRMDNGKIHCFQGLPRSTQHRARPCQRGNPLSSPCNAGRSEGPRNLDDVEVRCGKHPLWGRERRGDL